MKRLFLALLIACTSGFAQDLDSVPQPQKRVKSTYKIHSIGIVKAYAGYPFAFGNNLLAKSYTGVYSYNLEFSFLEIYGVNFGGGAGSAGYSSKGDLYSDDFKNAQLISIYPSLWKRFKVSKNWTVCPEAGAGLAILLERKPDYHDQVQEAVEWRLGVIGNYRLNNYFSLNAGVTYQHANFNVSSTPELEKYYSRVRQLQINFGLQFDFTRKRYKALYN